MFSYIKQKKTLLLLTLIVLLGFFLRVSGLGELPHGFQNDEASFFFNAITIKETLHDEDGRLLPVYLNSYIDPKPAIFSYFQIPFIYIFGKTVFASRLASALLGTISLLFIYYIFKMLQKRVEFALVITFLVSISPWHIVLSRSTQEVILSLTCFLVALFFQLKLLEKLKENRPSYLVIFAMIIFSVLSMYSYHSSKIILPMVSLFLFLTSGVSIFAGKIKIERKILGYATLTLISQLLVAVTLTLLFAGGLKRASAVGIFSMGDTQLVLDEQIRIATPVVSEWVIRLFHNKLINYSIDVAQTYFSHYTAEFLFFSGGDPARYVIPFQGLLYHIELLLLPLGLFWSISKSKIGKKTSLFMLFWMLISPVPSALTVEESVSMIRTAPMLIPLYYFVAHGWFALMEIGGQIRIRRKHSIAAIAILYFLGFAYFVNQYVIFQPRYRPWTRQFIDEKLASVLLEKSNDYSKVVIGKVTGQVYIYLALNGLISISDLQSTYPARLQDTYSLGKYQFVSDDCWVGKETSTLYVISGTCQSNSKSQAFSKLFEIRYFDGAEGYMLVVPVVEEQELTKI